MIAQLLHITRRDMEFLVNFTLNLSGRLETAKQEIARHDAHADAQLALSLTGGFIPSVSGFFASSMIISSPG